MQRGEDSGSVEDRVGREGLVSGDPGAICSWRGWLRAGVTAVCAKGWATLGPGATVTVTSLAAGTVELSFCMWLGPHC